MDLTAHSYQRTLKVATYECDQRGRMKLSCVLRQMQEIGNEHLDSLGYPKPVLLELGYAFLLSKIRLTIHRLPLEGEQLIQRTAPKQPKGVYFVRDIAFYAQTGETLMEAHTVWLLVNPQTHQIIRPRNCTLEFGYDDRTDYSTVSMKLPEPEGLCDAGQRTIRYTDIDGNCHLNNAVYADILYDHLPLEWIEDKTLKKFEIIFHHEAVLGDTLKVEYGPDPEQNQLYARAMRDGDLCFQAQLQYQ